LSVKSLGGELLHQRL